MAKKTLSEILQKAQIAWRELELGTVSQADKERCWKVWAGLTALDDEQAAIKGTLEEIILEFWMAPGDDAKALLRRLISLVYASAAERDPADQKVLDDIVAALNPTEDKKCLKERPKKPPRKAASRKLASK